MGGFVFLPNYAIMSAVYGVNMVVSLSQKEQSLLQKLILDEMRLYLGYCSSAKNYEDFLAQRGISLPIKLFYEYKYPDNMTPAQYETRINSLLFYIAFDEKQITHPVEYVKQMIAEFERDKDLVPMDEQTKQQAIQYRVDLVKDMSEAEKQNITAYILGNKENAWQHAVNDVQLAKALNPQLRDIQVNLNSKESIFTFLGGFSSGYAPMDIEYFMAAQSDITKMEKEQRQAEFEQMLGESSSPQYRIRPDRIDIILNEIKKQTRGSIQ